MKLSYVIVTHNRIDALRNTLATLNDVTPLNRDEWEVFVVDNASTDGTPLLLAREFPHVHVIRRSKNEGAGARSFAFGQASGEYMILLDDDSYPVGDTVARSIEYLDATPRCGALVGRVVLPSGGFEACALPSVMLSGAVCLRKSVVDRIGGFRPEFFRKAGEYDYSFRFWQAGYTVERFEDVVYRHDKVMTGRSSALAHRMDLRNNLIVVERFLPKRLREAYRADFTQRYAAMARQGGEMRAVKQALREARLWRVRERLKRQTLNDDALEHALGLEAQSAEVARWSRETGVRNVVIADFSKNLYATMHACQECGLHVFAIADDHPAFRNLGYRGTPVLPVADATALHPDGIVLSNVNPAQVDAKAKALRASFAGPVLTLWQGRTFSEWKASRQSLMRQAA
ncbi:MAG: glycosyltransferase [Tepidisphaeraceae bacterium]